MNNPVSSPAAASRAAETHVLDLTSVCVSSGTVRLPLSLHGHFAEGDVIALSDGVELKLQFHEPRTLAGLADFFARNDLKANDRVSFEFSEGQLRLGAVRRERRLVPKTSMARAAPTSAATAVVDGSSQTAPADEVNAQRQDHAHPAGEHAVEPARGGEEANQATVRAVKRVRIEGGTPPRQDLAAPQPIDRASSRDVWARRQHPAWRPLDTTDRNPPSAPHDHDSAYSETTVRAIRRPRPDGHANDHVSNFRHEQSTSTKEAEAGPTTTTSYAPEWPLVSRGRAIDRPRQTAPTAELDPYLDAPVDVDSEAERARQTAALPAADVARTGRSADTSYSLEAFDFETNRERQQSNRAGSHEEAEVVASARGSAQRERWGGLLGRLGLTRSANPQPTGRVQVRDDRAGARFGNEAHLPEAETAAPVVYTDQSVWPLDAEGDEAIIARSLLADPDFPASVAVAPVQIDSATASVADAASDTAAPRGGRGAPLSPQLSPDRELADTLSADIQLLERYLAEPETAAIVRCEDLARRLSIDHERVARAFQRMAEDRDRFTPLRGDAYMVRRVK